MDFLGEKKNKLKDKLHICLISEEFPPDSGWGGIATYTYTLAKGIDKLGHKVSVITTTLDEDHIDKIGENISVYRLKFHPPQKITSKIIFNSFRFWQRNRKEVRHQAELAWAFYKGFKNINLENKIDIVETPDYHFNSLFISLFNSVPLAVKLHTPLIFNYYSNNLPIDKEVKWLDYFERLQIRQCDIISSPSKSLKIRAQKWLKNISKKVHVVPNPIDHEEFIPIKNEKEKIIIYTGRLEVRKGVHILLEAFKKISDKIPEYKLLLFGHDTKTFTLDGEILYFKEYIERKKLLKGIEDRVIFAGKVDRKELPQYFSKANFAVFPSIKFENFPYSCLEAMSCGVAVIGTNTGGMSEMIQNNESGFVVEPENIDELSEKIVTLAKDENLQKKFGKKSREIILERYSLIEQSKRIVDFFKNVI